MSKTRDTGFLGNVVKVDSTGNVSFVSGSTTLMSISSSGAVTTTGVISGSNALSSSYALNADQVDGLNSTSFVFTSSYNTDSSSFSTRTTNLETASGSFSTRVTRIEGNYATTGSNVFLGAQTVCANITSTGTIIAQTLNVQQVTSSVVYSSGSNVFGNQLTDVQQFTGSFRVTGSATFINGLTSNDKIYAVGSVGDNILEATNTDTTNGYGLYIKGGGSAVNRYVARFVSAANVDVLRITPDCQITAYGKYYTSTAIADNIVEVINTDSTNGYGLYVKGGGTASGRYAARFLNAAGTDLLFVSASGNIGVGTTTPVSKLHLRGSGTSGQVTATQIWENTSSGTLGLEISGSAGSSYAAFKYGGGPGTGTATLTQAMAIVLEGAGAGRVGIGTNTPGAKLEVNGAIIGTSVGIGGSPLTELYISSGTMRIDGTNPLIYLRGGSTGAKGAITLNHFGYVDFSINAGCSGNYILGITKTPGGTDGILIHCNGNVGMGTSSPDTLLTLDTQIANFSTGILASLYASKGTAEGTYLQIRGTRHSTQSVRRIEFQACDGSSNAANIVLNPSGGCVGIGTFTPNSRFHIYQTGQPDVSCALYATQILQTDSQANYQRIRFDRDSCPFWGIGVEGASSTNDLIISGLIGGKTSGTWSDNVFRIKNSNGNIGVNTGDPKANFHVCGGGATLRVGPWFSTNDRDFIQLEASGTDTRILSPNERFKIENPDGCVQIVSGTSGGVQLTPGATSWASMSDMRKKKNFEPTQGLAALLQIEPVKYHFQWDNDCIPKRMGFIAQNIQPLIPEMVSKTDEKAEDGSDYLTITSDYILPVLVKSIQEQQCTICMQSTIIDQLRICLGLT